MLSPSIVLNSWTGCTLHSFKKTWFMWMAPPGTRWRDSSPPPNYLSLREGTLPYSLQFCIQHLAQYSMPSRSNQLLKEWMHIVTWTFHKVVVTKGLLFFTLGIFSPLQLWGMVKNVVLSSLKTFIHLTKFAEIATMCQAQVLRWTLRIQQWSKQIWASFDHCCPHGVSILVKNNKQMSKINV